MTIDNNDCTICGKSFDYYKSKSSGRFCTRACWRKSIETTKECSFCLSKFTPPCSRYKYCSQKCAGSNKTFTDETRRKMSTSASRPRKPLSERVTATNRIERVQFRQRLQAKIFARDNYTCQVCQQYGGKLQVDHIEKWSDYPELRFEITNCRTLCMACHYYVTFKRKLPEGIIWGHNLSKGKL